MKPKKQKYQFSVAYWQGEDMRTKWVTVYATSKEFALNQVERRFTNIYDITE